MKCEWDGGLNNPQPYYSLPAPGRYAVTLKMKFGPLNRSNCEQEGQFSLKCMTEIPSFMKGRISIVWNRRIREKDYLLSGIVFSRKIISNLE